MGKSNGSRSRRAVNRVILPPQAGATSRWSASVISERFCIWDGKLETGALRGTTAGYGLLLSDWSLPDCRLGVGLTNKEQYDQCTCHA